MQSAQQTVYLEIKVCGFLQTSLRGPCGRADSEGVDTKASGVFLRRGRGQVLGQHESVLTLMHQEPIQQLIDF